MPSGPPLKEFTINKSLLDRCAPDPGTDLKEYYYTTKELSGLLNLSVSTLSGLRRANRGPKCIVFGYRTVRYARADVLAYIEERTKKASSDPGAFYSSRQVSGPQAPLGAFPKFSFVK